MPNVNLRTAGVTPQGPVENVVGADGYTPSRTGQTLTVQPDGTIAPSPANLTKFPTGFVNRIDSAYIFNDATRTFTVGPGVANYVVFYQGSQITKTAPQSLVWPDVEGLRVFYFDGTGALLSTNDPNLINNVFGGNGIPIAGMYWDATNKATIRQFEERHDTSLPPGVHIYLHKYVSTVWESGGLLGNFTIDGTGNDDADAEFSVADVTIADEDIRFPIVGGAPQVLAPIAQIPVYYLTGAGIWRRKAPDNFPIIYSGTAGYVGANGRLPFNQLVGGVWQFTQIGQLNFVLTHYFATTDNREPIIGIIGQAEYTSQALARAGANRELANIKNLAALLSTERRALGTVIYQTSAGYGNTPKARARTTDTGENYVNWLETPIFTGVVNV